MKSDKTETTCQAGLFVKYLAVIEEGSSSFGAYVPDLPGCIAVGDNREEVFQLIQEAIEFHIEGMIKDGLMLPSAAFIQ